MAGALAERVFVDKITGVGFGDVRVWERHPFALAHAARYPLFTSDLIELMHSLLTPAQQAEVAVGVTVTATKPV